MANSNNSNSLVVHNIDITKYCFEFERALGEPQVRHQYFEFLKAELNSELLLFVQEVMDLQQCSNSQEAVKLANHIMEVYVAPTASQSPLRKQLRTEFEQVGQVEQSTDWLLQDKYKKPSDAFTALKNAVLLELGSDSYPRFLRSKYFLDWLRTKCDAKFIKTFGTLKATQMYSYTDADFGPKCMITDVDFKFGQSMAEDNFDWEMIAHSTSEHGAVFSFVGNRNYMPDVTWYAKQKGGTTYKAQCIVPYNAEFVISNLWSLDATMEYDTILQRYECAEYFDNALLRATYPDTIHSSSQREVASVHTFMQFPFPISSPRVQYARVSAEYFADKQQYILMYKSYQPDYAKHPLPPKGIELHCLFYYIVTQIDKNKSLVIQTAMLNIHGWATNSALTKIGLKGRGKAMHSQLTAILKQKQQQQANAKPYNDVISKLLNKVKATNL